MTDQVLMHESVAADATDAPTRYRRAEAAMWAEHGAPGPREWQVEVAAAGTRVRVLEHGEGRPVLFVHRGPNAASTWAPIGRPPAGDPGTGARSSRLRAERFAALG